MTSASPVIQKATVVICILLQGSNQKCNLLQSMFRIFLHSCKTPQKVVPALACIGVAISVESIDSAIQSLSQETHATLQRMGKTLLVSYVYDNFDIDFKTNLPTIERSGSTLEHLTAGTLVKLEHGVTPEHLKCSNELWARSPLNPFVDIRLLPSSRTIWDFLSLHPEPPHPSGLTRQQRFHSWVFLRDLCTHGPLFF